MTEQTAKNAPELQALWHEHFPLSAAMDVRVRDFSGESLTTQTPLPANTNIHGSAFAGSLYAIQALTAWGVLYLALSTRQLSTSIIHASGQIDFAQPVESDIVAVSSLKDTGFDADQLRQTGRIRLRIEARVWALPVDASDADLSKVQRETPASTFQGDYLARLTR